MSTPESLASEVRLRADERCEYCRMSQKLQGATFHIEHILPLTCGGGSISDNLALACPSCNLHKSDRSHALDPDTGERVPLFHPRRDSWAEHFIWEGCLLSGLTGKGRATIACLDMNHPRRIRVREAERMFGLFPPT